MSDYTATHTHLSLDDRRIILQGIEKSQTKAEIARFLGKDKSTIGKEIKLHRQLTHKCHLPLECANYKKCKFRRECTTDCQDYTPFKCSRRDRSPGVCNGCSNWSRCRFDKYRYSPEQAHAEYRDTLVDCRQGVNLTVSEAKDIASILQPLLKQGLSPYSILQIHPELGICEKTIYNYIEGGVFYGIADITPIDLRRQVSRKMTKKDRTPYKKRKDKKYLNGRLFKDYLNYMKDNPNVFVTQMDTVYNDITNGPFMQTFKFVKAGILLALYHEQKTAESMLAGVNLLESILGPEVFRKYVHVLLTDRGTEFVVADAMETSADGSRRTRVYYCDPMRSGQKGTLENKHLELRYIFPKETDLKSLGLVSQDALNLAISHIDSTPLEALGGKSPLELCQFLYPDLYEKISTFGVSQIEKDGIILKPYLLKNFKKQA